MRVFTFYCITFTFTFVHVDGPGDYTFTSFAKFEFSVLLIASYDRMPSSFTIGPANQRHLKKPS